MSKTNEIGIQFLFPPGEENPVVEIFKTPKLIEQLASLTVYERGNATLKIWEEFPESVEINRDELRGVAKRIIEAIDLSVIEETYPELNS